MKGFGKTTLPSTGPYRELAKFDAKNVMVYARSKLVVMDKFTGF